jgi:hypothetical protein
MGQTDFFGNTIAVTHKNKGGEIKAVGAFKGVEARVEWEHNENFGTDTVFRESVHRYKVRVFVRARYGKFHPEVVGEIFGVETPDTDIDGGSEVGTTRASIADSNIVPLFDLWGTLTGTNGEDWDARIDDVYFENAPFMLGVENDTAVVELTGWGKLAYMAYKTA